MNYIFILFFVFQYITLKNNSGYARPTVVYEGIGGSEVKIHSQLKSTQF